DVKENGNPFVSVTQTTTREGVAIKFNCIVTTTISSLVTAEEKIKKKNDVKARSMLLMALPNKHLMTFNHYKDAKSLFAAIETRFGGFKRCKSAGCLGNKFDLDTMSINDLYNNFKIVKQEVKKTASSKSSSQNIAFVSSPSTNSTNEVHTAYGVSTASNQSSTASTQVGTASTQTSTANLSDVTIYAFLANQSNGSQLVHEDLKQIYEDFALWDVKENGNPFVSVTQTTTREGVVMKFNCIALKDVSRLVVLGEFISQEDLNLKFFISLPYEWNNHVLVLRNKLDLDTMRINDLYNNFKIVEQEVTTTISSLVTAEEKIKKKNDVKARSMLLMALPNKHLMTFNHYKDAKSLFAAIETRFGSNEATKKTQKTLLKQMYKNFTALTTKSLDSNFNRL
nr:ribonuclease H-like domain-containing protein [Tanacetum cinerariifolium]